MFSLLTFTVRQTRQYRSPVSVSKDMCTHLEEINNAISQDGKTSLGKGNNLLGECNICLESVTENDITA